MWTFVRSPAGKGTLAMGLVVGLLTWPPMLSWLAATFACAYAMHNFRLAFGRADAARETDAEAVA